MLLKRLSPRKKHQLTQLQESLTLLEELGDAPNKKTLLENKLNSLKKQTNNLNIENAKNEVHNFAKLVVNSCKECGYAKETNLENLRFPPYATHSILLAFAYRKSETKKDLQNYLTTLEEKLHKAFYEETLEAIHNNDWAYQLFTREIVKITEDWFSEMKKNLGEQQQLSFEDISNNEWHERLVYSIIIQQYYSRTVPKLSEYSTVSFEGKSFANCMATTIRNLCNIFLYDQAIGEFVIPFNLIEKSDPKFKEFYQNETNKKTDNVENQTIHESWTGIVMNKPFVVYCNMLDPKGYVCSAPSEYYGFIIGFKLDDIPKEIKFTKCAKWRNFDVVEVNDCKFIFVDDEKYKCYELLPCLRNIIILFNQLFGLEIYENIKSEYFKKDFCSVYFPKLCNNLNLSYDDDTEFNDFGTFSLRLETSEFKLELNHGHGEINFHKVVESATTLFFEMAKIACNS